MKPPTLQIMEAMDARVALKSDGKKYLENLRKGYEGEIQFIGKLSALQCPHILLNDLMVHPKFSGQIQIDSLLIIKDSIILYEVKNYSGNWTYGTETFKNDAIEIPNPMIQALRTKNNFKQLIREFGYPNMNVEVCVVFIHPEFTLYQAPFNKNMIFHSQISDHMSHLEQFAKPLSWVFDELITFLGTVKLPPEIFKRQIPPYEYADFKKGIRCEKCNQILRRKSQRVSYCSICKSDSYNNDGVVRAIEEFRLLFPEKKLTGRLLMDWTDNTLSHTRCKVILKEARSDF